jgi:hypothetical protein
MRGIGGCGSLAEQRRIVQREPNREAPMNASGDLFSGGTSAAIDLAGRLWALWLSMWRTGALLYVESWSNSVRALANGTEILLPQNDNSAPLGRRVRTAAASANSEAASNSDKSGAVPMHHLAKPAPSEPQIHVFCPSCGELTTIRTMGPMTLEPSMEEVTYCCVACGTETKVQLSKHARFSIGVNEARYFGD